MCDTLTYCEPLEINSRGTHLAFSGNNMSFLGYKITHNSQRAHIYKSYQYDFISVDTDRDDISNY